MTYPITELYAWIVDDPSEQHGIVAFRLGFNIGQAVTSKRHVAGKLTDAAKRASAETGFPVRLHRFVLAETIETVAP